MTIRSARLARRVAAVAVLPLAAVTLTACGDDPTSGGESAAAPTAARHNAHDVSFAQGMIPHHRQAVVMADLAPARASSSGVRDLAAKIKRAQDPEINTMSDWLDRWQEKVPDSMPATDAPGAEHAGHDMPGMMSGADMAELDELSGAAFDRAFLRMMIRHHRGAIDMARTERDNGAYRPATSLAKSIASSQTAEITRMETLLDG